MDCCHASYQGPTAEPASPPCLSFACVCVLFGGVFACWLVFWNAVRFFSVCAGQPGNVEGNSSAGIRNPREYPVLRRNNSEERPHQPRASAARPRSVRGEESPAAQGQYPSYLITQRPGISSQTDHMRSSHRFSSRMNPKEDDRSKSPPVPTAV